MNYRKYYEEQTGEKIKDGYHVHHIDFNRENNEMYNLVAIPSELHKKFHYIHGKCENFINDLNSHRSFLGVERNIDVISEYMKIREIVFDYEMTRDWLCHLNDSDVVYSGYGIKNFKSIK